jgi:hypothetical protein
VAPFFVVISIAYFVGVVTFVAFADAGIPVTACGSIGKVRSLSPWFSFLPFQLD